MIVMQKCRFSIAAEGMMEKVELRFPMNQKQGKGKNRFDIIQLICRYSSDLEGHREIIYNRYFPGQPAFPFTLLPVQPQQ